MRKKHNDREMEPHYDFSKGVRGAYAKAFRKGVTVTVYSPDKETVELEEALERRLVSLAPDVATMFPTDESVNIALRHLIAAMPQRINPTR